MTLSKLWDGWSEANPSLAVHASINFEGLNPSCGLETGGLAQLRPFVKTPTKRATKLSYRAPACARVALAADSGSGGVVVSRQGLHHVWVEVDRELGFPVEQRKNTCWM
jgi:hypothetical protein